MVTRPGDRERCRIRWGGRGTVVPGIVAGELVPDLGLVYPRPMLEPWGLKPPPRTDLGELMVTLDQSEMSLLLLSLL